MENGNQGFTNFSQAEGLLPKEEMLEVLQSRKNIVIGIPKEITHQENRIPLTPEAVSFLCNAGHRIMIEAGAGEASNFSLLFLPESVLSGQQTTAVCSS